ncbi:MAG: DNA utilization protein GntX [bacterium ADurb.Bin400]|nr:MAG: DNA utilization protein GntX [bacterium ADurb.Bin400]
MLLDIVRKLQKAVTGMGGSCVDWVLDIFFPRYCVGCGTYGKTLCLDCASKIAHIKTPLCPECGRISAMGKFCVSCRRRTKTALTGLIVATSYESGPIKEVIHHLKYTGMVELASVLGELICLCLGGNLPSGKLVVVPVPLHSIREKERGFNQSELIARYISERLGLPGGLALVRKRYTQPQVVLSREMRLQNITGAFMVADGELVRNRVVLLVDDVATTAATLNECARVLRQAGARQVWGVVAARG